MLVIWGTKMIKIFSCDSYWMAPTSVNSFGQFGGNVSLLVPNISIQNHISFSDFSLIFAFAHWVCLI